MKEALAIFVIIIIQQSVEQSTNIVPTKYERVYVEGSSLSSIKTTNLGAQGYGWNNYRVHISKKWWLCTSFSLKSVQCASMCLINPNCEVYTYDSSQCEEGSATDLIGTSPDSPNAKTAFIDQDLYKNNKGRRCDLFSRESKSHWCFQPMEYGCGPDGQHALLHVVKALTPDQQHHVMDHSMQGYIALAVGRRLKHVKVCMINVSHSNVDFILLIAVEGTWSAWSTWGACSTTCNSGSRTRNRGYSGGQPCTGSASDTGNCDSKSFKTGRRKYPDTYNFLLFSPKPCT